MARSVPTDIHVDRNLNVAYDPEAVTLHGRDLRSDRHRLKFIVTEDPPSHEDVERTGAE